MNKNEFAHIFEASRDIDFGRLDRAANEVVNAENLRKAHISELVDKIYEDNKSLFKDVSTRCSKLVETVLKGGDVIDDRYWKGGLYGYDDYCCLDMKRGGRTSRVELATDLKDGGWRTSYLTPKHFLYGRIKFGPFTWEGDDDKYPFGKGEGFIQAFLNGNFEKEFDEFETYAYEKIEEYLQKREAEILRKKTDFDKRYQYKDKNTIGYYAHNDDDGLLGSAKTKEDLVKQLEELGYKEGDYEIEPLKKGEKPKL